MNSFYFPASQAITAITTPRPVIVPSKPMSSRPFDEQRLEEDFKVVCYFTNWAWYRQGGGKYLPSDIDSDLCTHVVYGFAVLDSGTLTIKPHDSWADLDNSKLELNTKCNKNESNIRIFFLMLSKKNSRVIQFLNHLAESNFHVK